MLKKFSSEESEQVERGVDSPRPRRSSLHFMMRQRTQSEYDDYRTAVKQVETRSGSTDESSEGRSRTSSWASSSSSVSRWMGQRSSSIHAVDTDVLESVQIIPDEDQAPSENEVEIDVTIDKPTCFICMGKPTKTKPFINVPCLKQCNLGKFS